jgi:hypothetical protein
VGTNAGRGRSKEAGYRAALSARANRVGQFGPMRGSLLVVLLAGCGRLAFDATIDRDGSVGGNGDVRPDGAGVDFLDSFDRPDQAGVGNNWIERTPGVFSIANNMVTTAATAGGWTINHVYRPTAEDIDDLEVSVEVVITDVTNPDWPQIFVRGDADASAYYIWVENGPTGTGGVNVDLARDGRLDGSSWTALDQGTVPLASVGERYRLRLSAQGFNPVLLAAAYERWTGTTWQILVSLSAQDSAPNAMASGHWGFSGHVRPAFTYDNFAMSRL